MTTYKPKFQIRGRQRGAVLLLVTFSLIAFILLAAFVLDFGRMYVIKSQLQNAADAGALRGAKVLDGTSWSLADPANPNNAEKKAIEGALTNEFHLVANPLSAADITVQFASHPFPASWSAADTACRASPSGCYFVRVDTRAEGITSFFAVATNAARALAVAGRYALPIVPLGICAIRPHACSGQSHCENPLATASGGNLEYGFIRGVAYNVPELNPLYFQPVPMWINPVDAPPAACSGSHDAPSYVAPFICTGTVTSIRTVPGNVYVNTGTDAALRKALNSRFDDPQAFPRPCNPLTAPPDSNVKQYTTVPGSGRPSVWMNPDPTYQTVRMDKDIRHRIELDAPDPDGVQPLKLGEPGTTDTTTWRGSLTQAQWGVLWSYGPERNWGATPPADYTTNNWTTVPLYSGIAPTYPGGAVLPPSPFPYTAGGQFHEGPPTHAGKPGRRLLNMVIIDCSGPPGPSACGPGTSHAMLPVVAIGQFFMQTEADFGGSPKKIEAEFTGIVAPPLPSGEIKLYR